MNDHFVKKKVASRTSAKNPPPNKSSSLRCKGGIVLIPSITFPALEKHLFDPI